VQERTRLLWRLEFLAAIVVDVYSVAEALKKITIPDANESLIRNNAVARLEEMAGNALSELRAAADPGAPFSAMAREWIRNFKSTLS